MNAKSRRLFPSSAQQPPRKDIEPSKARKSKGGKDHVGLVRNELALDRKREFLSCMGRSSGCNGRRSMESMPVTKDG